MPPDLALAARKEEICWRHGVKLYRKMSRAEAKEKGYPIIPVRWVDVNKGDSTNCKCRSRPVGKGLKAKTKDTLMAHELFSSMPPREMIKTLLSLLVTDNVPGLEGEELELAIFDISRAPLYARSPQGLVH